MYSVMKLPLVNLTLFVLPLLMVCRLRQFASVDAMDGVGDGICRLWIENFESGY